MLIRNLLQYIFPDQVPFVDMRHQSWVQDIVQKPDFSIIYVVLTFVSDQALEAQRYIIKTN